MAVFPLLEQPNAFLASATRRGTYLPALGGVLAALAPGAPLALPAGGALAVGGEATTLCICLAILYRK